MNDWASANDPEAAIPLKITIESQRSDLLPQLEAAWGEFARTITPPVRYVTEFGATNLEASGIACVRPFLIGPCLPGWRPFAQLIASVRLFDEVPARRNLTFLHECIHLYFAFGPHRQRWVRKAALEQEAEAAALMVTGARYHFLRDRFFKAITLFSYRDEMCAELFLKDNYPELFAERAVYLQEMRESSDLAQTGSPTFHAYAIFYELLRRRFCANLVTGFEAQTGIERLADHAEAVLKRSCPPEDWRYLLDILPRLLDDGPDRPEVTQGAFDDLFQRIMAIEPA